MKKTYRLSALIASFVLLCSCAEADITDVKIQGDLMESQSLNVKIDSITENVTKTTNNPLISNIFCADPTAIEYEGRLYVYGTNDHQQYTTVGAEGKNSYEHIKSIVMLSTDDMVNWTYHGTINVGEISPWIIASWAPSIVSRVEDDGKTHFYLYYSNSGWGTGVLTSTSPTGPWTDPLGRSIVDGNTPGLTGSSPFDPGAVIDDNGVGWLSFGGGENGARIVRLGEDMISFDSEIVEIPTLYHFEANELNYINGTFVYTYNNDWNSRTEWDIEGAEVPPACSMAYLTTKDPLNSESWEYRDWYFKNPGEAGMEYSNNHTHLHKYMGEYYLFYHSLFPQRSLGTTGGFRSLCVNKATVDEETVTINEVLATKDGVEQIKSLNPFNVNQAETTFSSSDIGYNDQGNGNVTLYSTAEEGVGALICVKGADFDKSALAFAAKVKGTGKIQIYVDDTEGNPYGELEFSSDDDFSVVHNDLSKKIKGEHDIYFVISDGFEFDEWQFF